MGHCEFMDSCPFFNDTISEAPSASDALKGVFCRGDYAACARYLVTKRLGEAPRDLWPTNIEEADQLLAGS